ncbi:5-oxoprolinase subunit C family protein [Algibacter pacificus]|uniref:5-oxoprolinase subunit C family protein n=1 Tax=Algibacter pacificus TaxID=2599389 RepID=UPI0011C8ED9C|nr:biotin-dependent carboxyltransferase family protein [Algibacter pacificus]
MIKVLKAGFYSTIQDLGRIGVQQFGVPYSGVMDRKAASFANALVGNNEGEAVLEMTMMGAQLEFKTPTCIAISGAHMSPMLNGILIENNHVVRVEMGDVLRFGKLLSGFRCYLAVSGGFKTETVMGSKSMYPNITKANKVVKNDIIKIEPTNRLNEGKHAKIRFNGAYITSNVLEVFEGPEFEYLSINQRDELFSALFTISNNSNRMGYQLVETIQNDLKPIITGPVIPGTVQLTPSGKLIVLMRDCQTTGGYPRVLQLSEASINVLSQKFTGQSVFFQLKSMISV